MIIPNRYLSNQTERFILVIYYNSLQWTCDVEFFACTGHDEAVCCFLILGNKTRVITRAAV